MARSQCDTPPCCLLFIPLQNDPPRLIIHAQGCYYCKQYKSFFLFPPLICPCDGAHYKPRMCITKTQSVFVQHQDVSGHHQDTSWSDKRAVKRAVQKKCRQKFLYCLQIRTTYVHKLYLPLMFHKSCQNNNNFLKKQESGSPNLNISEFWQ
jgi:hypothetical protein